MFLEEQQKKALSLQSFLILPVQRIPRYEMLLRDILKETGDDHAEYQSLQDALEQIKEIAAHVNESKRNIENLATVLDIHGKIQDKNSDFNLVVPGRKLLKEEDAKRQKPSKFLGGTTTKVIRLYIFSDILLWTRDHQFTGETYKHHLQLRSLSCRIAPPSSSGGNDAGNNNADEPQFALHVFCREFDEPVVFLFESQAQLESWYKGINEARDQLIDSQRSFQRASRSFGEKDKKDMLAELRELKNAAAKASGRSPPTQVHRRVRSRGSPRKELDEASSTTSDSSNDWTMVEPPTPTNNQAGTSSSQSTADKRHHSEKPQATPAKSTTTESQSAGEESVVLTSNTAKDRQVEAPKTDGVEKSSEEVHETSAKQPPQPPPEVVSLSHFLRPVMFAVLAAVGFWLLKRAR